MTNYTLADLGWSAFFSRQEIPDGATPMRISSVHRDRVDAISTDGQHSLYTSDSTGQFAAGDWVLAEDCQVSAVLDRQSLLKRGGAGNDARPQLLAANVATLGIVSSCNADFNPARLERYLVIAADAGCLPLVILTKADLDDDPESYVKKAQKLSPLLTAIAIDAKDPDDVARLNAWCRNGETLALVGSSGVGKTTLRNALTGDVAETQGIREDDAKGRHTTTSRALVRTLAGGWIIDTPGMRSLALTDVSDGIAAVFEDIEDLAEGCKFSDCAHETEPGCAITAALEMGDLDPDRVKRWRKLKAEELHNSETLAQSRARQRSFGKMVKGAMAQKRSKRGN
ncbi:MAG: ribosome small subunit-dependent GTPase A [Boseongicola sp.]|nr:ribosome small subunit-dependent GTPase A [Boseongicola sp.]